MTEIQQNRWDRLIRRAAGVVGGGSQVNDTLNELFPVIDVENVPGELLALMGTRLGWGLCTVTSAAGERPQCQLFNPPLSGTIVTITKIILSAVIDTRMNWVINNVAFTTLINRGSLRDTRLRLVAANSSVGELRVQSSAVPIGFAGQAQVLARDPLIVEDPNGVCVLSPGFGLNTENITNNSNLIAAYQWRERTLEPSEENL